MQSPRSSRGGEKRAEDSEKAPVAVRRDRADGPCHALRRQDGEEAEPDQRFGQQAAGFGSLIKSSEYSGSSSSNEAARPLFARSDQSSRSSSCWSSGKTTTFRLVAADSGNDSSSRM